MTTNEFDQLNLNERLTAAVADLGYTTPTPIQSAIIPTMLTGQDVIGQAQTGTGKTAAFALPILHNLSKKGGRVQALILAPTRELAVQTTNAIYQYGRGDNAKVLAVYGGQSYDRQIGRLKKGVDIVVGTPGRLIDLLERKVLDLSQVSTVVLDEADEMLSMGFIADIETLLDATPPDRQTALFSATLPQRIRKLSEQYMQNPQSFSVGGKRLTVDMIEQRYYLVNEKDKTAALSRLFEGENIEKALIFVSTRAAAGELAHDLSRRGYQTETLNGDLSQEARMKVMHRFRNNQVKVVAATDVAARGLDIDDITHVFNFDAPIDPEVYVHRVGRTGRAGKAGISILFLTPREKYRLQRLESYTKQKITRCTLPSPEEIQKRRDNLLAEQLECWLRRGRCRRELGIVEELIAQGNEPQAVAAAALKLAASVDKQRPIEPISEVAEYDPRRKGRGGKRDAHRDDDRFGRGLREGRPGRRSNKGRPDREPREGRPVERNSHEKGMVRLMLDIGSLNGVRANHVVGSLSRHADISGHSIGRISIENTRTFVDMPEQFVQRVIDSTDKYRIGRKRVSVRRA